MTFAIIPDTNNLVYPFDFGSLLWILRPGLYRLDIYIKDRRVNCGIATSRCNTLRRRSLDNETTLAVIRQRRAQHPVNSSDHVCQACWDLAQQQSVDEPRQLGHHNVCLRCGSSLASRSQLRICNVIQEWIMPRTAKEESHICHNCWVAADRAAIHMVSGPSTSFQGSSHEDVQPQAQDLPTEPSNEEVGNNQPEPTIVLPDYMRAIEMERSWTRYQDNIVPPAQFLDDILIIIEEE
ncbi:unnamed protein product [Parnassius mnemosyne]|uniref:Uncharacterized protein n=1 Tax=Parnassius mnemosyne TaxID=213953 RepID=A0AAV1LWI3_9NEOP